LKGRVATLWWPGLVGLAAATGSWTVLRLVGTKPHILWIERMPLLLYVPWILLLPLAGAAAAYLCRRAGGGPMACVTAGLFPAGVLLVLVCLGLAGLAISHQLDRPEWLCIAVGLLNWTVLPACALLLGTSPFLTSAKVPEIFQ
jgi:hypothetical protein